MKIYEIQENEKFYWRNNNEFGYWSNFPKESYEKEDYFVITALVHLILMRLCGIKAKLESK